jgi:hypothetical protein
MGVSSGFLFGVGLPLVVVLINIAAYDGTRIKTMWHEVPTYSRLILNPSRQISLLLGAPGLFSPFPIRIVEVVVHVAVLRRQIAGATCDRHREAGEQ